MVRRITFAALAALSIGCAGGGGETPTDTTRTLNGELTDGDVMVLDEQRADPYDFIAVQSGETTVRLHTQGFHGLLRVHDTEGNLLAQSVANGDFEAHVTFTALNTVIYKILVTGASSADRGAYSIDYSQELEYSSQIR